MQALQSISNRDGEPPALLTIDEAPGLFADALLTDEGQNLLFLSLWGRDTAIQEFLARLTLPVREGGLEQFHAGARFIQVGREEHLKKETGRMPSRLFGNLVHLWLYHDLAASPDRANRKALLLHRPEESSTADAREALWGRLWELVRDTCHLPLLPHWRKEVMAAFHAHGWLQHIAGTGMDATLLDLGHEDLEWVVTGLIQDGRLSLVA